MSTKMRQVSKEEFEVLTRFHPGEVRYYVDVDKALSTRNKGARINVKREPVQKKAKRKPVKSGLKPGAGARAINGTGRTYNLPILYTGKDAGYVKEGSISKRIETEVKRLYEDDPLRVIGRADLAKMLMRNLGLSRGNVHPQVSDLLKRGTIRIMSDNS